MSDIHYYGQKQEAIAVPEENFRIESLPPQTSLRNSCVLVHIAVADNAGRAARHFGRGCFADDAAHSLAVSRRSVGAHEAQDTHILHVQVALGVDVLGKALRPLC